jgi:hypothetical protein
MSFFMIMVANERRAGKASRESRQKAMHKVTKKRKQPSEIVSIPYGSSFDTPGFYTAEGFGRSAKPDHAIERGRDTLAYSAPALHLSFTDIRSYAVGLACQESPSRPRRSLHFAAIA